MVAELGATRASSSGSASATISHEGIVNLTINQDSVNRLMEGAQHIETAAANVNDTNAMDAIRTLLGMMAVVIRILVKLIVDFSGHISNFETMVEIKIMTLQS